MKIKWHATEKKSVIIEGNSLKLIGYIQMTFLAKLHGVNWLL